MSAPPSTLRRLASATSLLAILPACGATEAQPPAPAPLVWSACDGAYECASLVVPVDYGAPDGETLAIALLRAKATSPGQRLGSIVVNPGGPGIAMDDELVALYPAIKLTFPTATARFDIVAFDWRGVGRSAPLSCLDPASFEAFRATDLALDRAADVASVESLRAALVAGCEARADKNLLARVSTEDAARDMDRLRAALGEERLNYLGFSYGTWLGATYATMFPTHVRAFALDSAVTVPGDLRADITRQAKAYDVGLGRFFDACAAPRTCPFHGGKSRDEIAASFDALFSKIEASPIVVGARVLYIDDARYALADGLRNGSFAKLGAALAAAEAGDATALLASADTVTGRRADGGYDDSLVAHLAIGCLDEPLEPGATVKSFEAFANKLRVSAPRSAGNALGPWALCASWPWRRTEAATPIAAKTAPPLLVVAGRYDPLTGYEQGQALVDLLGNGSRLLTYEGDGHSASFHSACVRKAIEAFLVSPDAPSSSSCPAE